LLAFSASFARQPEDRPFENWLEEKVEDGLVSKLDAERLSALTTEKRVESLALSLAEAYTYGQTLAADYDRMVEKGMSLQQIMLHSSTYSRLQALYFIKHELIELSAHEFEVSGFRFDKIQQLITRRSLDPRYATLALSEVENHLLGDDVKSKSVVIHAAQTLPKNLEAFRLFQTEMDGAGIHVESLVKMKAAKIQASWEVLRAESTGKTSSDGKVIYPDADPKFNGPGNIYGNTFPKGAWALTFDDGPLSPRTEGVLRNLKKHDVKATFFVLSQQISKKDCKGIGPRIKKSRPSVVFPSLVRQEQAEKHAVESHSYYHSQSLKATAEELRCEVVMAAETLKEVIGVKPKFYRLPYGQGVSVRSVRKWIADAGMVHVHWTVDTLDWNDKDPDSIYRRTLSQMKSGRGIILFHDVHEQSVIASEKVMAYLKNPKNGLRAVTVPEIVDELNSAK